MKIDQSPLRRNAEHNTAAASAQFEEDLEKEQNNLDSGCEEEAVPTTPAKHVPIPKPIVADPRQGRASAEALRDSHPVTTGADAATTPRGLAKGVGFNLGVIKQSAQLKTSNKQLQLKLAKKSAAATSAINLIGQKDQELAATHRELAAQKRQYANLSSRLHTEGQRAYDQGYQHALSTVRLQPVHRVPVPPPVPAPVPDTFALLTTVLTTLVSTLNNNNPRPPYRGNRAGKNRQAEKNRARQQDKTD